MGERATRPPLRCQAELTLTLAGLASFFAIPLLYSRGDLVMIVGQSQIGEPEPFGVKLLSQFTHERGAGAKLFCCFHGWLVKPGEYSNFVRFVQYYLPISGPRHWCFSGRYIR